MIASTSALAEWKLIGGDTESIFCYIEPTSIKKEGSKATVWMLNNYVSPQTDFDDNNPYLSSKLKVKYDCKKETMKYLNILYFKEKMGDGKMINMMNSESREFPIPPNSIAETLFKSVCGTN